MTKIRMNKKLEYPFMITWYKESWNQAINNIYLINNIVDYFAVINKIYEHLKNNRSFDYLNNYRNLSEKDFIKNMNYFQNSSDPEDVELMIEKAKSTLADAKININLLDRIEKEALQINKSKLIIRLFENINKFNQRFKIDQFSDIESD